MRPSSSECPEKRPDVVVVLGELSIVMESAAENRRDAPLVQCLRASRHRSTLGGVHASDEARPPHPSGRGETGQTTLPGPAR